MNKLFELTFGSKLYGTDTPASDTDLKSIYLPTAREIVLGSYKKTISTTRPKQTGERNNKDDIDIEIFSLDRYLKLLTEGQTVALDILFAGTNMYTYINRDDYWVFSNIYSNKHELLSKDVTAFFGYAKQQSAKYGLKGFRVAAFRDTLDFLSQFSVHDRLSDETILPMLYKFVYKRPCANPEPKSEYITITKKDNKRGGEDTFLVVAGKYYSIDCKIKLIRDQVQAKFDEYGKRALLAEKNLGCDWKALSHAVRVNSQGVELLSTGNITFPRPDRDLLLKIKTGQLQYKEVEEIIVQGFADLESAKAKSTLRETPNQEWVDNFICEVYTDIVKGTL